MELENAFYLNIISSLQKHKVDFILIGGLAVAYHGYSRYTCDMDLWIKPEELNLERLYSSLSDMGYTNEMISGIKNNRSINHPTPIKLWDDSEIFKVDLMTETFQFHFTWETCIEHSNCIQIDNVSFPVININHLIQMKHSSTRLDNSLKDLVDADELLKIKKKLDK